MILIEVFLTLLGLAFVAAIIWVVFDYRDLRNKHEELAAHVAGEFAAVHGELDRVKQRAGL